MSSFLLYLTITLFVIVCLILILLVLIQKGRGGGLASAFGGGGGNTAFGSKTGDVLTWATSVVFGVFLVLSIALTILADRVDAARRAAATGGTSPAGQTENGQTPPAGSQVPPATPSPVPAPPAQQP